MWRILLFREWGALGKMLENPLFFSLNYNNFKMFAL